MTCSTYGTRHEVFRLLEKAYPNASDHLQTRLLDGLFLAPRGENAQSLDNGDLQYETYNLLVWLQQVAPDCPQPNGSTRYNRNIKENSSQANTGSVNVRLLPRADEKPVDSGRAAVLKTLKNSRLALSYQGDRAQGFTRDRLLEEGAKQHDPAKWGRSLSKALRKGSLGAGPLGGHARRLAAGRPDEDQWVEGFHLRRTARPSYVCERDLTSWRAA